MSLQSNSLNHNHFEQNNTKQIEYVKDSDVTDGVKMFPTCFCPYKNRESYSMVEINTGSRSGSILWAAGPFSSYEDTMNNFDRGNKRYQILQNCVVYNDVSGYI